MTPGRQITKYIKDELKCANESEKIYFDDYNPEGLEKVIESQHKDKQ